jgi:hypothetical protein
MRSINNSAVFGQIPDNYCLHFFLFSKPHFFIPSELEERAFGVDQNHFFADICHRIEGML